jgi:hypothetical protein
MRYAITRRDALRTMGSGFGMLGLARVAAAAPAASRIDGPMAAKASHFPGNAKHVIFLFLNGGPSQVDTFDPKPALKKYHGKSAPFANFRTERKTGNVMDTPFTFKKYGKSGLEVSEIFAQLGEHIDDVCVIRSMHTDRPNHEPSLLKMNCGHTLAGHPSMGSWITYGLGTENQSLPGFVVLCPGRPVLGTPLWGSGYLPGVYQGTYLNTSDTDPEKLVRYVRNKELNLTEQREQLDLLARLNRFHLKKESADPQLEASIQSMEVAYRMQTEALDAFNIGKETEQTRARYGDNDFARGCLLARRLVERGVRMVQVYFGDFQPWDTHDDILVHRKLAREADPAIASLLADLKTSGLLQETIVVIGGEFGRTPVIEVGGLVRVQNGRDHNNHGFTTLVAGGGFKGGFAYGATDELGFKAVENPVDLHDLHATILHQLGMDHTRLTFRYSGRDFRLTDVSGRVIRELLA